MSFKPHEKDSYDLGPVEDDDHQCCIDCGELRMNCYVCHQHCEPIEVNGGTKYKLPYKSRLDMTMAEKAAWFDNYDLPPGSVVDVHLSCTPWLDRRETELREDTARYQTGYRR